MLASNVTHKEHGMSKAVHIKPSGKKQVVTIGEGTERSALQDLQHYVGGGLIEAVYLNNGALMYVNEEGLLRGYWPNKWATDYANKHSDYGEYYIVGEAIIVGADEDDEGNVTDAPQELIDLVEGGANS